MDKLTRFAAKSAQRKPWHELFFIEDLDSKLTEEMAGSYALPLEGVRLAPSGSNSQPWRIIRERDDEVYHFYYTGSKKGYDDTTHEFKYGLLQNINLGIGMSHFQLIAEDIGLTGEWQVLPNSKNIDKLTYVASWVGSE